MVDAHAPVQQASDDALDIDKEAFMKEARQFINRELSWLKFNSRVLFEAVRHKNPTFEQAKFLSIVSSNLDEFFMVRVGKLERLLDTGSMEVDPSGLTPPMQLNLIRRAYARQVKEQYQVYHKQLLPRLAAARINILSLQDLDTKQRSWLSDYFDQQVMPVLTPRLINPAHPFPLLVAKRIYLAVHLQSDKGGLPQLSLVPVPDKLKRLVFLPQQDENTSGILLEDIIMLHIDRMFPYQDPLGVLVFRVTRNTDFVIAIDNVENLIEEMRKSLKRRSYGKIVRIEVSGKGDETIRQRLQNELEANDEIVQEIDGPLDLRFLLRDLYSLEGFEDLRYTPFEPHVPLNFLADESIFETIQRGDLLMHHPYDSFEPVLRFVREAADDPGVLAIKQTLYRVDS
ncbi:MAG: hypothetical protein GX781_02775 [Clostridiales bacterium]|nr:hypothetical protein [Clostridiales bacterium]